jgi:hypothetical protein
MEGFSFVTPVTGLNRPNTGKEDDDDLYCKMAMYVASRIQGFIPQFIFYVLLSFRYHRLQNIL